MMTRQVTGLAAGRIVALLLSSLPARAPLAACQGPALRLRPHPGQDRQAAS